MLCALAPTDCISFCHLVLLSCSLMLCNAVQFMLRHGPSPNRCTYNTVLHACGCCGAVHLTSYLMHKMQEAGLRPDEHSYSCVVDACAKDGQLDRAVRVVADMDKAGVKPNAVTFGALLDAVARSGTSHTQDAVRIASTCSSVALFIRQGHMLDCTR